MDRGTKLSIQGLALGVVALFFGLVYVWNVNTQLHERVELLSADLVGLRHDLTQVDGRLTEASDRQASKSGAKDRPRIPVARKNAVVQALSGEPQRELVNAGTAATKTPFELAKADKKSRSERYSDRIRADLDAYAKEHGVAKVTVDEAMLIIEAWAEDRRFYKDSVQSGDLSKDEARNETREGLSEVQDQLRIIFGDRHYAALDETISFLARLPGARDGAAKGE
jgi:hypothetical protein